MKIRFKLTALNHRLLLLTLLVATLLLSPLTAADAPAFSDIEGHWAEAVITKYKDAGIIDGYPDGTFKPDEYITCGELAKIITLAFDLPEAFDADYYATSKDKWYFPYLSTAGGYIPSYCPIDITETTKPYNSLAYHPSFFKGDVDVLRCHAAEVFALMYDIVHGTTAEFPEADALDDILRATYKDKWLDGFYWFYPMTEPPSNQHRTFKYIWLATEYGIMHGDPDGYFYPYRYLTRAEVLTLIDRILAG